MFILMVKAIIFSKESQEYHVIVGSEKEQRESREDDEESVEEMDEDSVMDK